MSTTAKTRMMSSRDEWWGPPTPASPEALELARQLVKEFRHCFWFWHPEATVENRESAYLVVTHLREYGGHRAWWAAQRLWKCL